MKIRTDLTAFSLTGLVVVAIVALVVLGHDVPELLTTIALVSLGVSGGAVAPTHLAGATSSTPAAAALVDVEPAPVIPTPAAAPAVEALAPVVPAVVSAPAAVPGRDMTETFPAITPEMIAADKAGQA